MCKRNWVYALALTAGDALFGLVPIIQKLTYRCGGSGPLTVVWSSVFAILPLMLLARAQGVCLRVDGTTLKKLGILAIGATGTALFLYSSYSYIPVGMATTLHFVYPALITLGLRIFFHQRFTSRNVLALALTLGGIVFMGASAEARANLTGMLLALISGVFWAFYIVYMEKSGLNQLPTTVVTFYSSLANIPVLGLFCALNGSLRIYTALWAWGVILLVAVLHRILAYALFQIGMRKISSFSAGILSTVEPASAQIFGVLILRERLHWVQLLGLFCILASIIVNLPGVSAPQVSENNFRSAS